MPQPKEKTRPSGLELVSEVSDLTAGLGLLIFTLTPLALPALALTATAHHASVQEIVRVVAFAASPRAGYVTGAIIVADGGRTAA